MINGLLILSAVTLYGGLHSLLAANGVKKRLKGVSGRFYRLFFNLIATVTLLPVLVLVKLLPDKLLYLVPSPWRWGLLLVQAIALLAAAVTVLQTGLSRFLGLSQLLQPDPLPPNHLRLDGAYRWVRHPLYFFSLILLWAGPVMTVNQAILYAGFSGYLFAGALVEERKLAHQFAPDYAAYQRRVPMLIPWKIELWRKQFLPGEDEGVRR